ncbi:hypothetical protein [Microbulbifer sp. JTAC008]|uniref:hypothetical protein n=1 Tax=Microbulbifer sp. JTAC008 TaxID=3243374 RepID=UPI0040395011
MNLKTDDLDSFLARNRITKEDWEKARIDEGLLFSIYEDYKKNISSLNETAELLARILQGCPQVHSVRWRVKDPEHLLEKIVRKRAAGSEKYQQIELNNYTEVITDLVGVRVLHLFKSEWFDIHSFILKNWTPLENVKAYIRQGDEGGVVESYKENGCDVELHSSGYRSVHYIISTQPTLRKVVSEIQVRTIFEEGWSEIDHKVRYPNFSDDKLISYFLTIFNRLAGNADEMGTFVKDLTKELSQQKARLVESNAKHEERLSKIEALANELKQERKQNRNHAEKLNELTEEIQELRSSAAVATTSVGDLIAGIHGLGLGNSATELLQTSLAGMPEVGLGNSATELLQTSLAGMPEVGLGNSATELLQIPSADLPGVGLGNSATELLQIPSADLPGLGLDNSATELLQIPSVDLPGVGLVNSATELLQIPSADLPGVGLGNPATDLLQTSSVGIPGVGLGDPATYLLQASSVGIPGVGLGDPATYLLQASSVEIPGVGLGNTTGDLLQASSVGIPEVDSADSESDS